MATIFVMNVMKKYTTMLEIRESPIDDIFATQLREIAGALPSFMKHGKTIPIDVLFNALPPN